MMISTKGRYALRVMIDLAEHTAGAATDDAPGGAHYVPLADMAERQGISEKYLESIVAVLSKNGFLDALRGKGGGYRLNRAPDDYTVGSILKLTEGSLAPVACLDGPTNTCPRSENCRTLGMWTKLYELIDAYFEGITLGDLLRGDNCNDFVI